jgi:hypothetical protein
MTLALPQYSGQSYSTHSIQQMFEPYRIPAFASLRVKGATHTSPTLPERLSHALHDAQTVVRNRHNRLDFETSRRALARLSELIDEESWDDDDAVPTRESMETLFDAISEANIPFTSLSVSAGGLLKATWVENNLTITAIGREDKRVSWSMIEKTSDSFKTETKNGSILEFVSIFEG